MLPVRLSRIEDRPIVLSGGDRARTVRTWYDDNDWVIRYLTIATHDELGLVPAPALRFDALLRLSLDVTSARLAKLLRRSASPHSPNEPLSPEEERAALRVFDVPPWWGGSGLWGDASTPAEQRSPSAPESAADAHVVASSSTFLNATIRCADAVRTRITDAVIDGDTWSIRLFVTTDHNASEWDHALVSPFWITSRRNDGALRVPFTSSVLHASPAYQPDSLSMRDERVLARYYGFAHND